MNSVRTASDSAGHHFRVGRWRHAEQLNLRVLEVDPDQIDALHQLAVIAIQTGRYDQAIHYLQAVLRMKPGLAAAHDDLGTVLLHQKVRPEAAATDAGQPNLRGLSTIIPG